MLTVMQQFLVRPTLYSIFSTFKCQSTAVVLARLAAVAERILWNKVFSRNWIIRFLWILLWCQKSLWMLCVTEQEFLEKKHFLLQKLWKWAKNRVFWFKEKFSHIFSLNLFYNENLYYLLCSCKNPILGKILFLRYRPKCSHPIRLQDF